MSASDVISCLKIYTEEKNGLDPISKGSVFAVGLIKWKLLGRAMEVHRGSTILYVGTGHCAIFQFEKDTA